MACVSHRWQFGHPSTSDLYQEELYKPDCIGRRTETPFWSRERRDFWAFQDPRCPLLALLGAGVSLRRRGRVSAMAGVEDKVMVSRSWPSLFRSDRDSSSASLLARFTDSPVVSTQPDPRFSPVNTLPLCINSSCCCMLACSCLHQATKRPRADEARLPSIRLSCALLFFSRSAAF